MEINDIQQVYPALNNEV